MQSSKTLDKGAQTVCLHTGRISKRKPGIWGIWCETVSIWINFAADTARVTEDWVRLSIAYIPSLYWRSKTRASEAAPTIAWGRTLWAGAALGKESPNKKKSLGAKTVFAPEMNGSGLPCSGHGLAEVPGGL